MALSRRRARREIDYWPGFVDALSTLLLAIMFLLSVFVIAQFLLSRDLSGRDTVLERLNSQIAELNQLLALERSNSTDFQDQIAALQASLASTQSERSRLQAALDEGRAAAGAGTGGAPSVGDLQAQVQSEQAVSAQARAQIDLLNQQLSALRQQIAALEDALGASESRDRESQTQIADLGRRLNVALAQRVQELARYRSDFFGRLREILADRENIRIVGDRFVFQSEVLFASGADVLQAAGQDEMRKLAEAIVQLNREIPSDINWIIRVDGHTDNVPVSSGRFADNWQLSTARAAAVVRFLVQNGVPANRLAATGFGEFQPLVAGDTPEDRARNRRIELKLTER
ncbi:peptidoglycan -binding protein [Aureimonas sp. AU4]|uniref:peptidoglycan -binding protein n=1 Tax=Aureimonas sp. AU4 TaxID=1638163 RepID=UPI00070654E9|nr:peptidoglycan -binding protein [Aureimonas sp. AU4]BAT30408.1 OmpA/MotB domain-containing protein [Aureimonas sp. AU4]